jgi:hypothetical protein
MTDTDLCPYALFPAVPLSMVYPTRNIEIKRISSTTT